MAASYPASIKSFSAKANGDYVLLTHVTDLEEEVVAIETALRTGPTALAAASFSGAVTLTGGLNTPLVVAQGGTGLATLTNKSVLVGAATGTVAGVAPSTSGNVLTSDGTDWASTAPAAAVSDLSICEGRLTLTSGTAVTTADVTGATNVYFAPYAGNRIALYDGSSAWNVRTFTQITIAIGTITAAKPYDLFCYDNGGTVTFDSPLAWTNSTTRATALVLQDGVLVKTGATTRRYIGTFYTTATTTTEDSKAKRFLWNYYNRVDRGMQALIATNSWTYTTGTVRQAEGSIANQLDFVVGFSEDCVTAISAVAASNGTEGQKWRMGIGFDSTSAYHADSLRGDRSQRLPVSGRETAHATWSGYPGVGRHYLTMLENGNDSGTTTWLGDDGSTYQQAGIQGMIRS